MSQNRNVAMAGTSGWCEALDENERRHRLGSVVNAVAALFLTACTQVAATAISDRCTPASEPVWLAAPDGADTFSIGTVGSELLLVRITPIPDPANPASIVHRVSARWFDADLRPTTEDFSLGTGWPPNPQWTAFEGQLHGQVWAAPIGDPHGTPLRSQVGIDALTPASTSVARTTPALPITDLGDAMGGLAVMSVSSPTGGDGPAPAVVAYGRPIFALNAIPTVCATTVFNYARAMIFDSASARAYMMDDPNCTADLTRIGELEASDVTLVPIAGGLGLFFRMGGADARRGHLHYVRVGSDLGVLDNAPIDVDDQVVNHEYYFPSGYQTSAAQVDGGPIFYLTRSNAADINVCSNLRLVDPNGVHPRYAAWQLPCYVSIEASSRNPPAVAPWMSTFVRVEPLTSGRAAVVYNQRTRFGFGSEYVTPLTTGTEWDEGVFLTTVNGLGQRTSEMVRVTPAETTALDESLTPRTASSGPFPHDIAVATAAEGNQVVVAWLDLRADAPGYYARRYECGPITP